MDLNTKDVLLLVMHPLLAVVLVYPLIGMVMRVAWQARQRRLELSQNRNSKIPAIAGQDHFKLGEWLTASVVGITLLGMTRPIISNLVSNQAWSKVAIALLIYGATIATLILLYKARQRLWKAIFATLTGTGLIVLGFQEGVYRRDQEWYVSHFYFGIAAALLMIFSVAIAADIYRDKTNTWRKIHIALNCIALLLFLAQGFTGTRDLLEIPLSWQEAAIAHCDFDKTSPTYKTCPTKP